MIWTATVPKAPPSGNVMLRSHFRVRKEMKGIWYVELLAAFEGKNPTRAKVKRKVSVLVVSIRQRDYANLFTGVDKLILDNMVALGWLVDDSPKWLDLSVTGETGDPKTVIEIEEG